MYDWAHVLRTFLRRNIGALSINAELRQVVSDPPEPYGIRSLL